MLIIFHYCSRLIERLIQIFKEISNFKFNLILLFLFSNFFSGNYRLFKDIFISKALDTINMRQIVADIRRYYSLPMNPNEVPQETKEQGYDIGRIFLSLFGVFVLNSISQNHADISLLRSEFNVRFSECEKKISESENRIHTQISKIGAECGKKIFESENRIHTQIYNIWHKDRPTIAVPHIRKRKKIKKASFRIS